MPLNPEVEGRWAELADVDARLQACWDEGSLRAFPGVEGPLPPPISVLAQGLTERPQSQTTNAAINNQSMSLKYETVGSGAF